MSAEEKNSVIHQRFSDLEDEIVKLKEQIQGILRAKDAPRVATLKDHKALGDACTEGDIELAKQISALEKVNMNCKDSAGRSPLHRACEVGRCEMVQYLCSLDVVDVQARTLLGETPLLLACSNKRKDVVEFLCGLESVDVNLKMELEEDGDGGDYSGLPPAGSKCEALDKLNSWYAATVKSIDPGKHTILIAFDGYSSKWDEWIPAGSDRIRKMKVTGGFGPIHAACMMGFDTIVESLCQVDKLDINAQTNDGNTALHCALTNSHDGTAEALLKIPEVITTVQAKDGKIPLHLACEKKCEKAALNMLERPEVDVTLQDKEEKTPLDYAAKWELFGISKDQWAEIIGCYNSPPKGKKSPLHIVCQEGAHVAVKTFCRLFDVNWQDEVGKTPLHLACKNGRKETVREILDVPGANLNLQDENGKTALHDACQKGHDEIAHALLEVAGIDINLLDKDGVTALCQTSEYQRNILHLACSREHHEVIATLLKIGQIDVNAPDENGLTPLYATCKDGKSKVVEMLCATKSIESQGNSLLAIACEKGYHEVAKVLLESNHYDPNLQDENGTSVLAIACRYKRDEVAAVLLEKLQFDAQLLDKDGNFLIIETYKSNQKVFKVLLQSKQFDANVRNEEGMSLLHMACSEGDIDTIKAIMEHADVDCNIQDKNDETALELLLRKRPERQKTCDCLQVLLQNQTFEVVIQKKTGVVTIYDLLLDNYGYASTECVQLLGVETFLFSQSVFVSYEDLLNIALFSGGEYGAVYKADIDIARKPNVNIVPRNKLKDEEAKGDPILIPVVCKISKSGASANEWYELQVLQNLPRHKNVVGLIAMCTGFKIDEGPVLYTAMVMNYKSGGSLLDQLKKRKDGVKGVYQFDLKYLCKSGLDIVSGVEHMHQHFYKHCDIAARNYLVGSRGKQDDSVISITDFGLSRPFADQHDKGTRLPYRWCAPETLRTGYTSSLSDIWMVGVTLSEICSYPYSTPFFYFVPQSDKNITSSFRDFLVAGNRYFWSTYRKRVPRQWLEVCEWCCTISQDERPTLEQISERLSSILVDLQKKEEEKRSSENIKDLHGDVGNGNIKEIDDEAKHDIHDLVAPGDMSYTTVSGDISDSDSSNSPNTGRNQDDAKEDGKNVGIVSGSNSTGLGEQYKLLDQEDPVVVKGFGEDGYIPERRLSSKAGEDVYISRESLNSPDDMDDSEISLNKDGLVAQNEKLGAQIKLLTERIAMLESANPG